MEEITLSLEKKQNILKNVEDLFTPFLKVP